MPKLSPSQSAEDYLERIHELIEKKGYARVVDIASSLKVKQASVTSMVQKLAEAGYLEYEKYRGLMLTDKGREVARRIQNRHATLSRFFSLFGLDAETQRQDIEGIEHHLSPETVSVLSDLRSVLGRIQRPYGHCYWLAVFDLKWNGASMNLLRTLRRYLRSRRASKTAGLRLVILVSHIAMN